MRRPTRLLLAVIAAAPCVLTSGAAAQAVTRLVAAAAPTGDCSTRHGHDDVNGDGQPDLVVGDPKAAVAGKAGAGFYLDLIVSAPDEDLGSLKDAGTVTTFAGREPDPGKYDHAISQDTAGIPGVAAAGEHFGAGLAEAGLDYLIVGVPNDRGWNGGVALRVPWSLLDGINSNPAVALTRAGSGTFGAALVSN